MIRKKQRAGCLDFRYLSDLNDRRERHLFALISFHADGNVLVDYELKPKGGRWIENDLYRTL